MVDPNPLAISGSLIYAILLLGVFLIIISIRFRSVARACCRERPDAKPVTVTL